MKVSERTLNIWAVVEMYKDKDFKNHNFVGHFEGKMERITSIKEYEHWKLRVWKEHFFRFSKSQKGESGFIPE